MGPGGKWHSAVAHLAQPEGCRHRTPVSRLVPISLTHLQPHRHSPAKREDWPGVLPESMLLNWML